MTDTLALPPAILLMGPTASGKTALASWPWPATSRWKSSAWIPPWSIAAWTSAPPNPAPLNKRKFRTTWIDIIDPPHAYSAAQFTQDARQLMAEITARGRVPLLAGGTMLYFQGAARRPVRPARRQPAVRAELDQLAAERGWPALHAELARIDPATAARLAPNDAQRIQRALEIHRLTGQPMSALIAERPHDPLPWRLLKIALLPSERSVLHQRIATRFTQMLDAGLLDEVRALRAARPELHLGLPSMRCVGYRQAWHYLTATSTASN